MAHPSLVRAVVTAVLAATDDKTRWDFACRCKVATMAAEDHIAERVTAALERLALNYEGMAALRQSPPLDVAIVDRGTGHSRAPIGRPGWGQV